MVNYGSFSASVFHGIAVTVTSGVYFSPFPWCLSGLRRKLSRRGGLRVGGTAG